MSTSIEFRNASRFEVGVYWLAAAGDEREYARLEPYSSYVQQTYAGHAWVLRDTRSGSPLGEVTARDEPLVFDLDPAPRLRSENADRAVEVAFTNATPAALALYWIDYTGEERHYGNLRPGDSLQQSTYAGHPWCARVADSGAEIALFVPDGNARQECSVGLHSRQSLTPVTIDFRNASPLTLRLEWVDFSGTPKPYAELEPGATLKQATFASHSWLLRDTRSGTVVDATTAAFADREHLFTADRVRSLGGVRKTAIRFSNVLPFEIELFWVDYEGEERSYAVLKPGEGYAVESFATHPWRARRTGSGEAVGLYLPGGDTEQAHAFSATGYEALSAVRATLTNRTHLTVSVNLLGEDGREYSLGTLSPRAELALDSHAGASLRCRDVYSGHPLQSVGVGTEDTDVIVDALGAVSEGGTPSVEVRFENRSPFAVKVLWVDFEGKEIEYATLRPGEGYTQSTMARHLWRIRERYSGHLVGLFVANEDARQEALYDVRSYHARQPTGITFENRSMLTVEVIWLDYAGREQLYKSLPPGGSVGYRTYVTHPWIVRDARSRRVLDWNWGDKARQGIVIDDHDIRPREGDKPVTIDVTNSLPFAVELLWLDYDGSEKPYATLESGESYRQSTFETHPWRARQRHSGDEIELYIAGADSEQRWDIALRSLHGDVQTDIEFVNLSPLELGVYWIDYEGDEVEYARIGSRESFGVQTYMSHPWVIRDLASGQAVGFTVGVRQSQTFNVTGDSIRSRKNGASVDLSMSNATGHDIEVHWIDLEGKEIKYADLAPGTEFSVGTFEHHAWRIRERLSKAELDLYIVGGERRQRHTIANALVRTEERKNGVLWPGEVALYEHESYGGRVWIVHDDIPDLAAISGSNDTISSLRLGPDTAVTLFRDAGYGGTNDVFHLDASTLADSDVGEERLSSLRLMTTVSARESSIRSTSRLTEEHRSDADGRLSTGTVYRSIVTVPPHTGAIDVWATEEVDIRVAGKTYTIDPVKSARLAPNAMGKLIVTIEPDGLGKAALMLRTSDMAERERFFVFPDSDVHTKILQLDDDALWENRVRLGMDAKLGSGDVAQVQSALRALSSTVPSAARSLSHGVSRDRYVVTDRMPYAAWALDMGGAKREGAALFRPLGSRELAEVNTSAERMDESVGQGFGDWIKSAGEDIGTFFVETVPGTAEKAAVAVADTATGVVEDVGDALEDAGEAVVDLGKPIVGFVADTATTVWEEGSGWVTQAAADTGEFVTGAIDDAGEWAGEVAGETAEFFSDAAEGVAEALDDALDRVIRVTVEVAGKLQQFVVDTVEKVGKFVQKVFEAAGVVWDKFVEFVKDVLGWDDIMRTHDFFVQNINQGIDLAQSSLEHLKGEIRGWIADIQDDVTEGIDGMIDRLGVSDVAAETRGGGIDTSEMSDKLDWFVSQIVGDGPTPGGEPERGSDNPLLEGIMSLVPQSVKDQLTQLLKTFIELIREFVEEDLPVVIDAFMDSIALFQKAIEQPDRAKELVLGAVLSIVKSLTVAGLGVIDVVITMLFEFFLAAIELLQTALNAKLEIPVLSALYGSITKGRDLSAISLFSLVMAVPTTIMSKLILGRAPFENAGTVRLGEGSAGEAKGKTELTKDELEKRELARDWAIGYGCLHAFLTVSDLVLDVQSGAQKETYKDKTMVTKRGEKITWQNRRGRHSFRMPDTKTTYRFVTGSTDAFPVGAGTTPSKGMLALELMGVAAFVMAQVAGNPTGHVGPDGLSHEKLEGLRKKGPDHAEYWSYTVWCYQWSYLCVAVLGLGARMLKVPDKVTDYAVPALTTAVGITHMGIMSKAVDIDRKAEGGYTRVTGRRHGGWMFDTLPGISKVLTYKELNAGTLNIPLIIHSTLFVTMGHMGEAIVYWVRAGVDPESDDFDLR